MAPSVLILGATGGCGSQALTRLLDRGCPCVVVVRSVERLPAQAKGKKNLEVITSPGGHLEMKAEAFSELVRSVDAVVSALGHNMTFKGVYGQPRRLCADTVQRVVGLAKGRSKPLKLVVVSTEGVDQPGGKDPKRGCTERALLKFLECGILPPHNDNVEVIDELAKVGPDVNFCAVRPADMLDGEQCTYECHPVLQSGAFAGAKTTRANVGAFMADLVTEHAVWEKWKNSFPHCLDVVRDGKKEA